jgi:hypothetical protein
MGLNVYTLRKNPITAIEPQKSGFKKSVSIGYAKYAYRYAWGWDHPAYKRNTARYHAMAEKARAANPGLVLVTWGDPKEHDFAKYGPMPVLQVSPDFTSFYDTKAPGKRVGELRKNGKSYIFERCDEKVAA